MGIWMFFFVYSTLKEFLTIFFIITFIGTPTVQIIPCMLMSLVSCLVMAFKRPYKRKLDNILNLIVESAYFLIYIAFLSLHYTSIVPENLRKRLNLGYFMIVLIIIIIGRCLVDLVVGLIQSIRYIKKYCSKKTQVVPAAEKKKKSTGIKAKAGPKRPKKLKSNHLEENSQKMRERDDSKSFLKDSDESPEQSKAKISQNQSVLDPSRSVDISSRKVNIQKAEAPQLRQNQMRLRLERRGPAEPKKLKKK